MLFLACGIPYSNNDTLCIYACIYLTISVITLLVILLTGANASFTILCHAKLHSFISSLSLNSTKTVLHFPCSFFFSHYLSSFLFFTVLPIFFFRCVVVSTFQHFYETSLSPLKLTNFYELYILFLSGYSCIHE